MTAMVVTASASSAAESLECFKPFFPTCVSF